MFYIGFVLCLIGLFYVLIKTFRTKNILSPQIFLFAGLLLFLYMPALANDYNIKDETFNSYILVGVLGCFVASFVFPYNILSSSHTQKLFPKEKVVKYGAYIYVACLIYEIVETIIAHGSIIAVFVANRLDSYLGEDLVQHGSPVRTLLFEAFKILFYFYINYLYCNGNKKKALLFFVIPMIHHRFTAVTRYDFIAMAAAMIVFALDQKLYRKTAVLGITKQIAKKKINYTKIFIVAFIGIYGALAFMRVANYTRHGITDAKLDLAYSSLVLGSFKDDANYYEYFHELYNTINENKMGMEYGQAWYLYPVVNFIPRNIWPDKPYTSFSVRGTEGVYWSYTSGKPVVTFTILGEGYAQFGLFGCFLCPFIFIGCRYINFRQAKRFRYSQLYILIIMFSLLTYMRGEAPIFHAIVDGLWLWIIGKWFSKKTVDTYAL